jgi:uncharacterized protein YqhQ
VPKGEYLQYGGQAIIEGVMMRSPRFFSVAVRAPNGQIVLKTEAIEKTWIGRQKWLKWPFLRGTLALLDSMALGYKALKFSTGVQLDERYAPPSEAGEGAEAGERNEPERAAGEAQTASGSVAAAVATVPAPAEDSVNSVQIGATLIVALCFGLFLFVFLPNLIAERAAATQGPTVKNLITGLIKIVFFLAYIWGIGMLPDIKRLFRYHGAEHKAINTLEDDQDLTIENCRIHPRLHPRCGTSFAIVVLIVSLIVFTYVPRYPLGPQHLVIVNVLIRFVLEIIVLPIVAGLSYELIRLAGRLKTSAVVTGLFYPGLMTQYLTTGEPADDQTEVALAALKACVEAEQSGFVPTSTP